VPLGGAGTATDVTSECAAAAGGAAEFLLQDACRTMFAYAFLRLRGIGMGLSIISCDK
jgi:hypothetical protein